MTKRETLGEFISIKCFKALIVGMEDLLGAEGTAAALISAGRQRGQAVALETAQAGKNAPTESLASILNLCVGPKGTCLCQVTSVADTEDGGYYVKIKGAVGTAGESVNSPRSCSYTMGALMGFLESVSGKSLTGKHVEIAQSDSFTEDFIFNRQF
jgi:hypothetical protein